MADGGIEQRWERVSAVIADLEALRIEIAIERQGLGAEMPLDEWCDYAACAVDDEPSRAERQQDCEDARDELVTLRSLRIGGDR